MIDLVVNILETFGEIELTVEKLRGVLSHNEKKEVNSMDRFGDIELTIVQEHNARANVPFPAALVAGSTVDLASVTLDLSQSSGGVLLQGGVNWSAAFTIPPTEFLGEKGFAEVTFQLLRDGEVIYQVTETLRQKDFAPDDVLQTNTTYDIASLLHLDTFSLTSAAGLTTYTLRATDVALFKQDAGTAGSEYPPVAAVGAVTFLAQELEVGSSGLPVCDDTDLLLNKVERVIIDEIIAPLPATIPFATPLLEGDTLELARVDVQVGGDKDGILLLAVVNWGLRVTSDNVAADVISSGYANVTFELLCNGAVIYRTMQTAVQTFISDTQKPTEMTTFEIADISYLDIISGRTNPGINTYVLQATDITIIGPNVNSGSIVSASVSVGPVTLAAEDIDGDKVKKIRKSRRR